MTEKYFAILAHNISESPFSAIDSVKFVSRYFSYSNDLLIRLSKFG